MTGQPDDQLADPKTASAYLSLLMALAYALLTRYDISVFVLALQKFLQNTHLSACPQTEYGGSLGTEAPHETYLQSNAMPETTRSSQ